MSPSIDAAIVSCISADVGQRSRRKTSSPSAPWPSGSVVEVDVHPAGERVGDDERRRGEVVRLHLGMDARLEVPVAGEHRAGDEVVTRDRLRDLVGQRARVADAGRAAVADGLEAELVEVAVEARALVVLGDDLRAGRERRLHPRPPRQPALDRLLREQPGGDHHLRVRGVRARGDRGDHDGAVVELELLAVELDPDRVAASAASRRRRRLSATGSGAPPGCCSVVGSDAGNVSATARSCEPFA